MLTEILIVVVLILVNGALAMSELAVVSSRPARLKVLADQGNKGAAIAIALADDPGRFLSSVQIGITLVGILSGAFSGATLGLRLSEWLRDIGAPANIADVGGVGVVVVIITYGSLILGELVPKQIALRNPEAVASRVAGPMFMLARIGTPIVWLLDVSGKLVLRLLGQGGQAEDSVTEEEVRTIIAEATTAGILETEEHSMISGVMRLADRSARGIMTPRLDVVVVDVEDTYEENLKTILGSSHSKVLVQEGDADSILGALSLSDLLPALAAGQQPDLRKLVRPVPVVMEHADALDVIDAIRSSTAQLALVVDEYGHFEGIITFGDVIEVITGVYNEEPGDEPAMVQRSDGSWLVAGWMPVDDFRERFKVPVPRDARFETLAGYVLASLNHLPTVGETFERDGWRFEVVDLDGHRIDKVLIAPLVTPG
ncbi:hemolysin family protein [Devosia sp. YIM 151766]|uniref:hemolysin family protein n=1 Tax=Devosia sp. YIM 151766 TaxID=3017325 RepID=UPI00255D0962|nr:hemolysin family protein [Devosia sp. YIM 151766]WIY54463.1 hemolysin family protein [Devosia sp. YIM 151766]